jgi:C_GCAxxG_C_C family probable redox protein
LCAAQRLCLKSPEKRLGEAIGKLMPDDLTDPIQTATDRFARGLNCSQAVFSAFAPRLGLSDELALKLASPLGAGLARQGQVCGALTGALMVLGLQYGGANPEDKETNYQIAEEFVSNFKKRYGAILCRELLGLDISTPGGLQAARERHLFTTICPALVKETAKSLTEFSIE